MLEALSALALVYFKVGGIFGFGVGALAQLWPETRQRFSLVIVFICSALWLPIACEVIWSYRKT